MSASAVSAAEVAALLSRGIPQDKIDEYSAAFSLFAEARAGGAGAGHSITLESLRRMLSKFGQASVARARARAGRARDRARRTSAPLGLLSRARVLQRGAPTLRRAPPPGAASASATMRDNAVLLLSAPPANARATAAPNARGRSRARSIAGSAQMREYAFGAVGRASSRAHPLSGTPTRRCTRSLARQRSGVIARGCARAPRILEPVRVATARVVADLLSPAGAVPMGTSTRRARA